MDCGIHAREWISPAFCQWFVYQVSEFEQAILRLSSLQHFTKWQLPFLNKFSSTELDEPTFGAVRK